jgi:uncharacterized protein YegP (UPF0339 family)
MEDKEETLETIKEDCFVGYSDCHQIYKDTKGEWRWRRIARNGQIIATSGEGYKNFNHCFKMILRMCHECSIEAIELVE